MRIKADVSAEYNKVSDIDNYFASASEAKIITQIKNDAIDLNIIEDKGVNLYMYSAIKGYFALFSYLNSNINLNKALVTKNGEDIIHCAAIGGNKDIMAVLLASSTNPDIRALNGSTPLQIAAFEGHTEVVRLLLADSRVDPTTDNNYAIRKAAWNGQTKVVRLLLNDSRVDPAADNNYAIRKAIARGHTKVVRLLLNNSRVDPTADNNYAIRKAAWNGQTKVVRLLLNDSRVDPAAENNYAIRYAAAKGHTKVVRLLLNDLRANSGAAINIAINTISVISAINPMIIMPIILALKLVSSLFPDSRFNLSMTTISTIIASILMISKVGNLLFSDSRINPAAANNEAVREAASYGHTEVVKLLMKNKAVNSTMDYNALAEFALKNKYNNLYAILESSNSANKYLLNLWMARKDEGSIISNLPEDIIKREIIQKMILLKNIR